MQTIGDSGINLPVMMLYGFLILIYLIILRKMLDILQEMGKKHEVQKFVVDNDIRKAMTAEADRSMNTFDSYRIAILIAKIGLTSIGMAALIIMSYIKLGLITTILLIGLSVLLIWTLQTVIKMISHIKAVEVATKVLKKGGNTGTIVMLCIALVVVLFVMTLIN